MILIDSNVFMYAAGSAHSNKASSIELLERVAVGKVDAAVDAEVLQEILHRYRAIGRWADGRHVYDLTRRIVVNIVPITAELLDATRGLLDKYQQLTARDALHAAACRGIGAGAICSFDQDFDKIKGLKRVEPAQVK